MLIILSYSVTTICLFSPCIFLSSHLLYYYGDGHECYSLSYNLSLWLRLQFVAQIIPALGVFSGWLLCVPLIFFFFLLSTAFLSRTRSCCRFISCIICTSLRIGKALKESWFLLLERGLERSEYSLRLVLLDRHTSRPRGGQS